MVKPFALLSAILAIAWVGAAQAQDAPKGRGKKADAEPKINPAVDYEIEARFGPSHVSVQQLGVKLKALGGSVKEAYGSLQIPTDWPEQTVKILKEEITPAVKVGKFRETGLLKQYLFHIPFIEAAKEESILITVEYTRRDLLIPEDTSAFVIPKKVDKELKIYLGDSPKLDPKASKVSATLKEIGAEFTEETTAWEKVEAVFNWVKENINRQMTNPASTADILKSRKANPEDAMATFVALCRAAKVPARMVWLTEGVAAEFYLQNEEGKGRWFPCSYGAASEFGFSTEKKPIMLKGDSFRIPNDQFLVLPDQKGELRQVVEALKCSSGTPGAQKPTVDFIRTMVSSPTGAALPGTPGIPAVPGAPGAAPPMTKPEEKKPGEAFIPIPKASPNGGTPATPLPGSPTPPKSP